MNRPDLDAMELELAPRSAGLTATGGEVYWRRNAKELLEYARELEEATVVVKCTGCPELPTLEQLSWLIHEQTAVHGNDTRAVAEAILRELGVES